MSRGDSTSSSCLLFTGEMYFYGDNRQSIPLKNEDKLVS